MFTKQKHVVTRSAKAPPKRNRTDHSCSSTKTQSRTRKIVSLYFSLWPIRYVSPWWWWRRLDATFQIPHFATCTHARRQWSKSACFSSIEFLCVRQWQPMPSPSRWKVSAERVPHYRRRKRPMHTTSVAAAAAASKTQIGILGEREHAPRVSAESNACVWNDYINNSPCTNHWIDNNSERLSPCETDECKNLIWWAAAELQSFSHIF